MQEVFKNWALYKMCRSKIADKKPQQQIKNKMNAVKKKARGVRQKNLGKL